MCCLKMAQEIQAASRTDHTEATTGILDVAYSGLKAQVCIACVKWQNLTLVTCYPRIPSLDPSQDKGYVT